MTQRPKGRRQYPSEVDVVIDGQRVARERLPPGPFDLQNIVAGTGVTDATLIIRDPFGNEEVIDTTGYIPRRLLREGVDEFTIGFGLQRESFGISDFDYGDWGALGFYRRGVENWLTLGAHAVADKDVVNGGVDGGLRLGRWGEVEFDSSVSLADALTGYAGSGGYAYRDGFLSFSVFGRAHSRNYSDFGLVPFDDKVRHEASFAASIGSRELGTVSARHAESRFYEREKRQFSSLNYSRRLFDRVNFTASLGRDWQTQETTMMLNFSMIFGEDKIASARFARTDDRMTQSLSISKSADRFRDFGYRLEASHDDTRGFFGSGEITATTDIADLRFGLQTDGHEARWQARAAGAVALIGGGVHLAQPIQSSYALAKVGLEGLEVDANHNQAAVTGGSGDALVTGLGPYFKNRVSIDPLAVPYDYGIDQYAFDVSVYRRAGVVLDFGVRKSRAIFGTLFLKKDGRLDPAEFWTLKLIGGEATIESLIGRRGEFYVEDVPPKQYSASVALAEDVCLFKLVVPETDEGFVDLGEVICELE